MIKIDIAGVVFGFLELSESVLIFLQHKYKSNIILSSNNKCHLYLSIISRGRGNIKFSNQLKIGMTVKNGEYILNAQCDNQLLGVATINMLERTCFIELMDYNEEALDLFISVIWRMVSILHGKLLIHASAIMLNNQAVLFCGHSGAGKSTILNLLQQECLTDEMACLFLDNKHVPMYHEIPWRNYDHANISIPLHSIYILEKAENIYCRSVPAEVAEVLLSKFFYFNLWIDSGRDIAKYVLKHILKSIPVQILGFNMSESAKLLRYIKGYET